MDTALKLKNRIKEYLEVADERILKIINAIIDADMEVKGLSSEHKEILDERLQFHKENPNDGKTWEESKKNLMEKYGL